MSNLEIEIKFHLEKPGAARAAIIGLGAASLGRVFETNHILDNPARTLRRSASLLRLRQAGEALLTFKSPSPDPDSNFKVRRELETAVDDFATTQQILSELGFSTVRIYEKWRETFILQDTHLCLDTLPYGEFLEIEGSKTAIVELARKLGLAWSQRSVLNYHELFQMVKTDRQLPFSDITFSNFKGIEVDMRKFKNLFEVGE